MGGSGKGGNNRRKPFRHRNWDPQQPREGSKSKEKKAADFSPVSEKLEKKRGLQYDRPKWTAPKPPALSVSEASCPWCEKPIKDMASAIADPASGSPVHFDCVMSRITEREPLEAGETISYIGGGRFGVVHYSNPNDVSSFTIKRIFEWEKKEDRSEWRMHYSDHYSVT